MHFSYKYEKIKIKQPVRILLFEELNYYNFDYICIKYVYFYINS